MMYPKTLQLPACVVVTSPPMPGEDDERNFVLFNSGEKCWTDKVQTTMDLMETKYV